ncbi:M56 family metallopeptidase [Cellulomonas sp. C5510]|uniref:M56 family metallopeptidase n=1 Tax=Cellulomonas sp. C5510 TaxID=2871170 RepID=UPI001C98D551|nr:M56 family metallopeptidase [Cellulomonas sp. C5510]QZN87043.1 M56 family metallopeptidase [Cellulomonas sp. C5510]
MTALTLAALAVLLSRFAPVLLARARLLDRVPRAAVVLWQAVAGAAVLAAVGAALAAPEELVRALRGDRLRLDPVVLLAAAAAAALAGVIVLRLAVVALRLGVSLRRRRRRQRELLDLLDSPDPEHLRLHVLGGQVPMAYCVPGRPASVVVTEATLRMLSPSQLEAVVAHERAHLRARHDLVLEGFTALHVSFPRFVRSRLALEAVRRLLEMLADDGAVRRVGAAPLRQALAELAPTADDGEIEARIARLGDVPAQAEADGHEGPQARAATRGAPSSLPLSALAYALALAVLAVPTVAIVSPWLRTALGAIGF